MIYRFASFEVDIAQGELRKFGLRIRLERKPWLLLLALLDRPGDLITRTELQKALWPDGTFVDFEHGLNVAVKKLRGALCESSESPRYVETISGEGYRFIAPVEQVVAAPSPAPEQAPVVQSVNPQVDAPMSVVRAWWQRKLPFAVAAIGVFLAILTVAIAQPAWRRTRVPDHAGPAKIMLVVLPFENLSADPSQDYLSDGITEELSARLGNLTPERLGVIGRTSAMTYKHSRRTISQIGKELGVGFVLEGSVRRNGDKLRVTAQLVEVAGQTHVWAEDYDRNLSDLFKTEDEVASDIAQQVGVTIAVDQPARPLHPHIPNAEAHEDYLIARYYWYKRTPEGWQKSVEYFRRATEKDPQYAAAYAGLAESQPPDEHEALAAARKSVQLDPGSGEAWVALGWVELFREWDLRAAHDALKTAIRLDPNYAPAHHVYAGVLEYSGRFQEALDQEKEAVRLDPLALIFRAGLAQGLAAAGQNEEAMEQINQIFAIDPHYAKAYETLGNIYLTRGMYKEAIREYETSERYSGFQPLGLVGYAYASLGDKQKALQIRSQLEAKEKKSPSGDTSGDLAAIEIGLGHRDAAIAWLEKQYQQHDNDGPLDAKDNPIFAPLHSDLRFQRLMARLISAP